MLKNVKNWVILNIIFHFYRKVEFKKINKP